MRVTGENKLLTGADYGSNITGKILVVDDNHSLCRNLKLILGEKGYVAETAHTGAEALERASEEKFSIVLLDLRLPDFEGTELLEKLSEKHPDMDIIIITGYATIENVVESLTTSATDYMRKPLNMDDLLNKISSSFEKKRLLQEKQEAEEALRRSEEKFRSLVNSLHDIVFIFDEQNRYTDYYSSDEELLYQQPADFLNKQVGDVLPPKPSQAYRGAIHRARKVGSSQTIEYQLEIDGKTRWFSATISPHEDGIRMVASVREITEHKKAAKALETAEELYQATVQAVEDAILVVNPSGYPMHWNSKFVDLCDINAADMKDISALEAFERSGFLFKQSEQFFNTFQSISNTLQTDTGVFKYRDGRTFEWFTAPILKEETLVARVWTFSDITQLKRAEESAYLYLDLLGHDVRNYLQGLTIGVDMLESSQDQETTEAALSAVREGVRKTARLVDKVKATQGLSNSPLQPRRLDHAVAQVIEQYRARFRDAELEIQIEPQEATVAADEYLEYLIMNLVENAVQENPNSTKKVWIKLCKSVNGFELSVSDNGKGLPDRRKEELFDKSRRYGGVGLHQVKQIAEKYGGYVYVTNRVPKDYSKGAEFRVYFPRIDE